MLIKILRKFQPNFQHYVKKIVAQAKKWFSYEKKKKRVVEYRKRYYEMRKNKNLL